MPVYRYKNLEEMRKAHRLSPTDPRLPGVIRFVWELGWVMAGRFIPPRGVFKFRTIEEANAHRKAWEQQRLDLLRKKNETGK